MLNKETDLYISIAERPGEFGARFHNEGFEVLGLNKIYLPRRVLPNDLEEAVKSIRGLDIKGCGVSMPHKERIISLLDRIDFEASEIAAVNTIVNKSGILRGYNTDAYGARKAITEKTGDIARKEVVLLGAGGAARAIAYVVYYLGGRLTITNRTPEKAKALAVKYHAKYLDWQERDNSQGDILINATSLGMGTNNQLPVSEETIKKFDIIMDIVVGETELLQKAQQMKKVTIPGRTMVAYQGALQFKLYTGQDYPLKCMEEYL